jgi:hypothetical protein
VLFVNPEYLKRFTYLTDAVDDELIVPSVILAQDKYVQSLLGTDLIEALQAKIADGTIDDAGNENYLYLLDTHVRSVTNWWTIVEMLPALHVRLDGSNLVLRTSENSSPINTEDLQREVQRARNNAQLYGDMMIKYLTYNTTLFPEYTSNNGQDISPTRNAYDQNGMMFSHGNWRGDTQRLNMRWITYPPSYG